jgi:hypothetical protein
VLFGALVTSGSHVLANARFEHDARARGDRGRRAARPRGAGNLGRG